MYRRRGKEREKEVEGEEIRPKQDIRVYERRRGQAASKEGDRQIMGKGVTELASGSVGEEERAAGIMLALGISIWTVAMEWRGQQRIKNWFGIE